jgi:hypothetical protein
MNLSLRDPTNIAALTTVKNPVHNRYIIVRENKLPTAPEILRWEHGYTILAKHPSNSCQPPKSVENSPIHSFQSGKWQKIVGLTVMVNHVQLKM